jgi:HEPN domain-containing protein
LLLDSKEYKILDMRKESQRLLDQSRHDANTAAQLLKIKIYYASVFFAEQAAEKAIKALHIEKKRKAEFTHDLIELAQGLDAPREVLKAAAELSPDYIITRYPDAANGVPATLYDEESAVVHLGYAVRIIEWVRQELKLET